MPPVPRNVASARGKTSSKEILLPSGKENARPSTSGSKKVSASGQRDELRRRVSLSSADDRNKENGSVKTTRAISESFPVKKTPFHVHCDERNAVEDRESRERPKIVFSADAGVPEVSVAKRKEECVQLSRGVNELCLPPQKNSTEVETKERKLPPSRIPRRSRSSSACTKDTKPPRSFRRSASVEFKMVCPQERRCKAADLKFGWSGGQAIEKQTELKSFGEGARGLIKKTAGDTAKSNRVPSTSSTVEIKKPKAPSKFESKPITGSSKLTVKTSQTSRRQSGTFQLNRNPTTLNKIDRIGPRAIDRIKAGLLRQETQVRASDRGSRTESTTETPVDGAGPPSTITLQGVVRKTTKISLTEARELEEKDPSQDYDFFPRELLYHEEYHDDLPIVEYEREELSPRLSDEFLQKHLNAEQRRLVVIFMIRLGMHCRHPSHIIYQAVKLFDAAMDRMDVETAYIQLVALASLWIALKKHQNFHKIPLATSVVSLARDLYMDRQDLLMAYERKILQTLSFNITFADAYSLFTHYLISCRRYVTLSEEATTFIYYSGGYFIDLTLLDEQFCRTSASLVALAAAELALGIAIDTVVPQARPKWLFWRGLLFAASPQITSRFPDGDIDRSRIAMLNRVLSSAGKQSSFEVVYKKYSRSRHCRISALLLERVSRISYLETFMP